MICPEYCVNAMTKWILWGSSLTWIKFRSIRNVPC